MSIKNLIKQLSADPKSLSVIENAKVLSVSKKDSTCKVQLTDGSGLELEDVKLKAVTGSGSELGCLIYPKVKSFVSICMIDDDPSNLRVLDCTEIESVSLTVGPAIKIKLNNTGVIELAFTQLLLGGSGFGGLPKIGPLVKQINTIEDKVNDLVEKFKSHTHTGVQAGGGSTAAPVVTLAKLEKTKQDDLENKNVSH